MKLHIVIIYLCLLFLSTSAYSSWFGDDKENYLELKEYNEKIDYYPAKHWSSISPTLLGYSKEKLNEAKKYYDSLSTDAFLVIDNGLVIASWGKVTKRYKAHSMRKSLMSVMYGIAEYKGQIDISKNLSELNISEKGGLTEQENKATIQDLLMAKSGIYLPAAFETKSMKKNRPERGLHKPGTYWWYNNWDFNALLTIYEQEVNDKFFEAFNNELAKPLQMEQFRIKDTKYRFEKKSEHAAYRFRLSALDMARIGLLYLRDGLWEDKRLLSKAWVEESTKPLSIWNEKKPKSGYGYLWWVKRYAYYAAGKGGHKMAVLPAYNLVIVNRVNTEIKGKKLKGKFFWKLVKKIIKAKKINANIKI